MDDSWGHFSRARVLYHGTAGQVVGREVGGKEEGGADTHHGHSQSSPYMAASEEQQHPDGIYTAPRYFYRYAPRYTSHTSLRDHPRPPQPSPRLPLRVPPPRPSLQLSAGPRPSLRVSDRPSPPDSFGRRRLPAPAPALTTYVHFGSTNRRPRRPLSAPLSTPHRPLPAPLAHNARRSTTRTCCRRSSSPRPAP